MKSLKDLVKESFQLHNNIITESFASDYIRQADDFVKQGVERLGIIDILHFYLSDIRWNKVTNDYAIKYDPNDPKLSDIILKMNEGKFNGFGIVYSNGKIYSLIKKNLLYKHYAIDDIRILSTDVLSPSEMINEVKSTASYVIVFEFDSDNDPNKVLINKSDSDSRASRAIRKNGIVYPGDVEYYKQVAADNIKRYKEIISKKNNESLELIKKDVIDLLDKVNELSVYFAKNISKFESTDDLQIAQALSIEILDAFKEAYKLENVPTSTIKNLKDLINKNGRYIDKTYNKIILNVLSK